MCSDSRVSTTADSLPNDIESLRALALKAIDKDASFDDEPALVKLAESSNIRLEPTIGGNRTILDSKDVSSRIRERDVTEAASRVSVHPKVREWMVSHQRAMGAGGGIVMEGRHRDEGFSGRGSEDLSGCGSRGA